MTYQVWFSIKKLPSITEQQEAVYSSFLANLSDDLGDEVNGRILKRCMFTGTLEEINQIELYLQSLGKEPIMCGVRDFEGNWVVEKNQIERDKYFQSDLEGNIPVDNTSAGWLAFNDALIV